MRKLFKIIILGLITTHALATTITNLRQGGQLFMEYCSGCHSLQYMRYDRLSSDLKWQNIHNKSYVITSLDAHEATKWFGVVPPDLSLIAKTHDRVWLYNFLTGFYPDAAKHYGVNNTVSPESRMPNVLESLKKHQTDVVFEQYILSLIDFLTYVSDPSQLRRIFLGMAVLAYLSVLLIILFALRYFILKKN